jgi:hypothetical protein
MTVAQEINDRMAHVRKFAPNLVCLRAALMPFDDVIGSEQAGPQPQADDYDPEEEPYFTIEAGHDRVTVLFRFTADSIMFEEWVTTGSGKKQQEVLLAPEAPITLTGVFNYLRQLPRPVTSF